MISFVKRIIFKIKLFFWKRRVNKIYGYNYDKVIRSYDYNSLYPYLMDTKCYYTKCYYTDTDSLKRKGE